MPKLKFVLFVDVEGDFYYYVPSPHFSKKEVFKWKINRIIGKLFRYANPTIKGIKNIVNTLNENNFPACFCIAGHLYLTECNGWQHFSEKKPENKWYYNKIGNDWYYWDLGRNSKTNHGFYFGDFIKKKMKGNKLFSFGLHGFAHEALTLEKKEVVESIVKSGAEASKKIGIKSENFAAPFDMVSDEKKPNVLFDILKKYKIKNVIYSGLDNGFERKRFFDVRKILKNEKLNMIWLSDYFEGSFSNKKMKRVLEKINKNIKEDAVYCLATHDFTHKTNKNILKLVKYLKKMEKEKNIEILNLNYLK